MFPKLRVITFGCWIRFTDMLALGALTQSPKIPIIMGLKEYYSRKKFFITPPVEPIDLNTVDKIDQNLLREVTDEMIRLGFRPGGDYAMET